MNPSWAITPEKIGESIRRIVEVALPRRVILFGSAARGVTTRDSDVDFLVVAADRIESPRKESVRIRRALRGINMAIDIVVVRESRLLVLADRPGLIYREAIRTGRVVYESAG
jgi:predicted nucleotidyltransferase